MLDFEKVLSIDGGATLGLIDGISFSLKFNPTLKIHIENIKVSLTLQFKQAGAVMLYCIPDPNLEPRIENATSKWPSGNCHRQRD